MKAENCWLVQSPCTPFYNSSNTLLSLWVWHTVVGMLYIWWSQQMPGTKWKHDCMQWVAGCGGCVWGEVASVISRRWCSIDWCVQFRVQSKSNTSETNPLYQQPNLYLRTFHLNNWDKCDHNTDVSNNKIGLKQQY